MLAYLTLFRCKFYILYYNVLLLSRSNIIFIIIITDQNHITVLHVVLLGVSFFPSKVPHSKK